MNLIAAAVIEQDDKILLIQQKGELDSEPSWALPGGVVKAGEMLNQALSREIQEETGLNQITPGSLLYVTQIENPSGQSRTIAFVFSVTHWQGELQPNDPDDLILGAAFLPIEEAIDKLSRNPWLVMREPVIAYLSGKAKPGTVWCYHWYEDDSAELITRFTSQ
jgi:8-oxo-dGTP diphosphatase